MTEEEQEAIDTLVALEYTVTPPRPNKRCISCDDELRPEMGPTQYQYDNALAMKFSGGYGMFIDDYDSRDPWHFLCHDCAHDACDKLPWLSKLLDPLRSHSHRYEYWDSHPDHEGWDKKASEVP